MTSAAPTNRRCQTPCDDRHRAIGSAPMTSAALKIVEYTPTPCLEHPPLAHKPSRDRLARDREVEATPLNPTRRRPGGPALDGHRWLLSADGRRHREHGERSACRAASRSTSAIDDRNIRRWRRSRASERMATSDTSGVATRTGRGPPARKSEWGSWRPRLYKRLRDWLSVNRSPPRSLACRSRTPRHCRSLCIEREIGAAVATYTSRRTSSTSVRSRSRSSSEAAAQDATEFPSRASPDRKPAPYENNHALRLGRARAGFDYAIVEGEALRESDPPRCAPIARRAAHDDGRRRAGLCARACHPPGHQDGEHSPRRTTRPVATRDAHAATPLAG